MVAHYRSPRFPARDRQDPHDLRRQEPASGTGWSAACRARSTSTATGAVGAINMERLNHVSSIIDRSRVQSIRSSCPTWMAIALVLQGLARRRLSRRQTDVPTATPEGQNANEHGGPPPAPARARSSAATRNIQIDRARSRTGGSSSISHYGAAIPDAGLKTSVDGVTEPHHARTGTQGHQDHQRALDESAGIRGSAAPRWKARAVEVGRPGAHGSSATRRTAPRVRGAGRQGAQRSRPAAQALFSTVGRTPFAAA